MMLPKLLQFGQNVHVIAEPDDGGHGGGGSRIIIGLVIRPLCLPLN